MGKENNQSGCSIEPCRCDAIAALEDWQSKEKSRWVEIQIDDGYGATCWQVTLHRGSQFVKCNEVLFIRHEGINPTWHEQDGNLYCSPEEDPDEDWPGLAATIKTAIECADKFWPA